MWRVFQPQGKLRVCIAGQGQGRWTSDLTGEKTGEGGTLGGTHVGASGVCGGGQSKSDEDRMTM